MTTLDRRSAGSAAKQRTYSFGETRVAELTLYPYSTAVVYIWQEQKEFRFSPLQLAVVILLVGVMSLGLCLFVQGPSPIQSPEPVTRVLHFIGRHTLEIYASS